MIRRGLSTTEARWRDRIGKLWELFDAESIRIAMIPIWENRLNRLDRESTRLANSHFRRMVRLERAKRARLLRELGRDRSLDPIFEKVMRECEIMVLEEWKPKGSAGTQWKRAQAHETGEGVKMIDDWMERLKDDIPAFMAEARRRGGLTDDEWASWQATIDFVSKYPNTNEDGDDLEEDLG